MPSRRKKKSDDVDDDWDDENPLKLSLFFTQPKTAHAPTTPNSAGQATVTTQQEVKIPTFSKSAAPGISIKELEANAGKKAEDSERVAQMANENKPFTEEDFKKVWKLYEERIPEKKILVSSMQSCMMNINKDYSVDIVIENVVQKQEFEKEMVDLLTFLSKSLKNGQIKLNIRISEAGENKKTLTPEQRFREMLERNHAFSVLKAKLGLELD